MAAAQKKAKEEAAFEKKKAEQEAATIKKREFEHQELIERLANQARDKEIADKKVKMLVQ